MVIICLSQCAYGDFYNFRNHLVGERGALMGGAYTALAEDISGSFYNNAGLAFMKRKALSMNGSVYSFQDYTQQLSISGTKVEADYNKFFIVPTTFGVSVPLLEGLILVASLFEIDRVSIDTTVLFGTNNNANFKIATDNYLFGPSLGIKISKNFALGVSVFYHLFQLATTEKTNIDLGEGARYSQDIQDNGSSGGFVFGLGFKGYLTSRLQVGAMYTSETMHTDGTITFTENTIETGTPSSTTTQGRAKGDVRLPHRLAVGVAYEEKGKYALAFDVIYYFKLDYLSPRDYLSSGNNPNQHIENQHFDFSLGAELYITETIALRAGVFSNTSSAPASEINKIQMFGGSFGVAHIKGGLSTGIGMKFMFGSSSDVTEIDGTRGNWKRLQVEVIIGSSVLF